MANGLLTGLAGSQGGSPMPAPQGGAASAPTGQSDDGQTPNVSPEEQAQYDKFVDNGLALIYDKKTFPAILTNLKAGPDPVQALAATTVQIVTRLSDSAQEHGEKIDGDVMFHGGLELLQDLATTAERAGIHKFTPQELDAATYRAMDLARQVLTQKGELDPNQLKQQFGQIVQADRAGQLDKVIPGIDQYRPPQGAQSPGNQPAASPDNQPAAM